MSKEMVISANPHETRVAILEEGQLCEFYVEREKEFALVGSIYKGRVTRVLPGMQSAFVEIGLDSDAFLYVSDFLEDLEEFDHIVTTAEEKVQKMQDQGGQVFSTAAPSTPALEPVDVESAPPASSESVAPPHVGVHDEPAEASDTHAPGNVAPSYNPPPANRPRQENRHEGRPHRGGGRDFRGGRGGGRRGGRPNRGGGGGGRGGDRRYGRELPQSKYASHRPYEDPSTESAPPPDGYVPTILPGESLAKYKAPASAPVVAPPESAPPLTPASFPPEPTRDSLSPAPPSDSVQSEQASAPLHTPSYSSPAPSRSASSYSTPSHSSSTGFEPLPGESIAKWKTREPSHEEPVTERNTEQPSQPSASASERTESDADASYEAHETFAARDDAETEIAHFEAEAEAEPLADHLDAAHHELTEEETAALTEHVAEAQSEAAALRTEEDHIAPFGGLRALDEDIHEHHDASDTVEVEYAVEDTVIDVEEHELDEDDEPESDLDAEADEAHAAAHAEVEAQQAGSEALEASHENSDPSSAEAGAPGDSYPAASENQPPQEKQPWNARVQNDYRSRMQHPSRRGGRDRGGRHDRGGRPDRGRRPQHGPGGHSHGHRTQPRRTQLISDLLKQGQEIIVQIAKEPLGKKGARITSHVALPGRYLVYMPTLDHTGVSRKIASAEDRARLRHLVNEAKGQGGGGFIVRTAAASATAEEVKTDVEFLMRTWQEIKSRSEQRKAPSLLHRDLNLVERILRDYMTPDFGAIWVDSEEEFAKVVEFMSRFQPALVNRVKLYTKETPVFEEFGIQQEIDKGLRPKVWLKSGGYIVINHTEALVAIDVNTGKFVGKGSNRLEDTIVRTNLEAVKEVVRQMRLRDLGGIIIIDFIDMEERRNREKVMAALEDALRADRAPSKVLRFNEFGLVAITRKRTKQALERTLCQPCPYCTGSGMVKSIPTLCYEIQAEARKMAPDVDSGSLTLRLHPEIAKALKTRESSLIEELERWTKKSIIIQADPTLHWEQYDIY